MSNEKQMTEEEYRDAVTHPHRKCDDHIAALTAERDQLRILVREVMSWNERGKPSFMRFTDWLMEARKVMEGGK